MKFSWIWIFLILMISIVGASNFGYDTFIVGDSNFGYDTDTGTSIGTSTVANYFNGSNINISTATCSGTDKVISINNATGVVSCGSDLDSDTFVANYSTFLTHISQLQLNNGTYIINSVLNNGSYFNTLAGSITGSGTLNYIPMWNGTTSLNNSAIYQNGSLIGINTTSPQNLLNIIGNANITGTLYTNTISTSGASAILALQPSSGLLTITGSGGSAAFRPSTASTSLSLGSDTGNAITIITSTRLVSIGAGFSSPSAQLHVKNANNNQPTMIVQAASSQTMDNLRFTNNSGNILARIAYDGSLQINGSTNTNSLFVNATLGRVGINTTTPQNLLNVVGSINQSGTGNLTGNMIYGGSWNKTTGGFETVNLVTPEVYVPITKLIAEMTNGVTITNGTGNMTIQMGGTYQVILGASIEQGQVSQYGIKLFINNVGQDKCYSHFETLATVGGTPSFICFLNLVSGDVINVRMDDHTNPVNDPTISNLNFNILRVGN